MHEAEIRTLGIGSLTEVGTAGISAMLGKLSVPEELAVRSVTPVIRIGDPLTVAPRRQTSSFSGYSEISEKLELEWVELGRVNDKETPIGNRAVLYSAYGGGGVESILSSVVPLPSVMTSIAVIHAVRTNGKDIRGDVATAASPETHIQENVTRKVKPKGPDAERLLKVASPEEVLS